MLIDSVDIGSIGFTGRICETNYHAFCSSTWGQVVQSAMLLKRRPNYRLTSQKAWQSGSQLLPMMPTSMSLLDRKLACSCAVHVLHI